MAATQPVLAVRLWPIPAEGGFRNECSRHVRRNGVKQLTDLAVSGKESLCPVWQAITAAEKASIITAYAIKESSGSSSRIRRFTVTRDAEIEWSMC